MVENTGSNEMSGFAWSLSLKKDLKRKLTMEIFARGTKNQNSPPPSYQKTCKELRLFYSFYWYLRREENLCFITKSTFPAEHDIHRKESCSGFLRSERLYWTWWTYPIFDKCAVLEKSDFNSFFFVLFFVFLSC